MEATVCFLLLLGAGSDGAAEPLSFVCPEKNDLYRVVTSSGKQYARFDDPERAVEQAAEGSGVLILAGGYPEETTALGEDVFRRAAARRLRLYIEYPRSLPGLEVGRPISTHVERVVISSDFFGGALEKLRILSVNGLHYVPVRSGRSHMVAARVAGFDHAVYGLPRKTAPILFQLPGRDVLVATTKLSHFVTGRYAPRDSWRDVWPAILTWLNPGAGAPNLRWTPDVRPAYGRDERLPGDHELRAIRRGIDWYNRANMIVHPSFEKRIAATQRIEPLPPGTPAGDGSLGCLEAVLSVIRQDGSQSISSVRRGDCTGESAMALAFGGRVLGRKACTTAAINLLDHYLLRSEARKKERGDPRHGAYGLIAWGITTPAWYRANYGDDNARLMLGTLAAAALNGEDRWDEAMMMCLLANLRTTGRLGFRGDRIDIGALGSRGWQPYFRGRPVNFAPHFEAYLWACYLWAYKQTAYELFFRRAETALKMTMARYTDGWRWTNGLAQEKARILLPLAWLVRVRDTQENRALLRKAVDGLLALQDACGAIREELGIPGRGLYPPPRSNEAYGTNEASLIARNGDPVADLLYTTNFAFLGLHEAAAATGDRDILEAESRLAEFLCRIQVVSEAHPQVDGGWFRAFDFGRWEHWGCNADHGWGAWCIESGWTQGWIIAVLALRQMKTSLWDLTGDSRIEGHFEELRGKMIPDGEIADLERNQPIRVAHAAVGKPVQLAAAPSPQYSGAGPGTLVDGQLGDLDHATGLWLGFHGDDLNALIDLGEIRTIRRLDARFLQSTAVGIYLPGRVVLEVSGDGKTFRGVARMEWNDVERRRDRWIRALTAGKLNESARYVRIRAENVGTIPAGYPAAGRKAWLFADEVMVNPEDQS